MAKLEQYREYVQRVLIDYVKRRTSNNKDDELEMQTIFDTVHDHYQLIYVGWDKGRRVYGPVIHLDITNEKIWLQWNGTEDDIAADLVELGVPKQDIVLGFHSPYMRQFTDYAVG
ncbi:FdxN element excision controlling factor protein [Nostoc piscinale CENA21]|uniref:FdxN element excision controlling factor protein n=1 Tax=Nostoc piscinale CENA21 TaxID=224013 RepID=A0A0M4TW55_9NOSO|nr:XisI protein [Nostoc piscinale]ALF54444.1 FdxN element excision controlling factor protein [Nostoc piscinale CENA21]